MKSLEQRRLDFLEEMVSFYGEDTSRRSIHRNGDCLYWDKATGNKCSIGRYIPEYKYNGEIENEPVKDACVFELLPKEIQELGKNFLTEIQRFHDDELGIRWNDKGLTESGKYRIEIIKEKILEAGEGEYY